MAASQNAPVRKTAYRDVERKAPPPSPTPPSIRKNAAPSAIKSNRNLQGRNSIQQQQLQTSKKGSSQRYLKREPIVARSIKSPRTALITRTKSIKGKTTASPTTASRDVDQQSVRKQSKSSMTATRSARQKKKPNRKGTFAKHKRLIIGAGIALVLLALIGLAIGLGVGLSYREGDSSDKDDGRLKPIYSRYCSEAFAGADEECVIGSAPDYSTCEDGGKCVRVVYTMEKHDGDRSWMFSEAHENRSIPVGGANTHLCRREGADGQSELGACKSAGGECDRIRGDVLADESSWYEAARWEDRCDEPSPCWMGEWDESWIETDISIIPTREKCSEIFKERPISHERCKDGIGALVWLQHQRCVVGKNRTTRQYCQGFPFLLRVCAYCAYSGSVDMDKDCRYEPNGCGIKCSRSRGVIAMPTGTACKLIDKDKAYCFKGECVEAMDMGDTDCKKEK